MIAACAVLHNVSLKLILPEFTVEGPDDVLNDENIDIIGAAARGLGELTLLNTLLK